MNGSLALGLLLALAGCVSVYLGAEHQRLVARRWPTVPARLAGALLLATGQVALLQALRPVAAVFVLCVWAMLLFTLLPGLDALRRLHEVHE